MSKFFGDREITLYASGTAALAQAITHCVSRSSARAPEVIIPAYGCPDLVAACLHASVYPRLVDIAASHWSYDLTALISTLSPNTVAVIAVNLLGLGDSAAELSSLCKQRRISLIQDSAQFLPREPIDWPGDYVVLSFGRGKPLNLLHGGALIAPTRDKDTRTADLVRYSRKDRLLSTRAAGMAFNFLTRPHAYRLFSTLPGMGLGNVTYKPLHRVTLLPDRAWNQIGIAFELYCRSPSYRRGIWGETLEAWAHLGIAPLNSCSMSHPAEPLRLALLAPDRDVRENIVESLNRAGLGASRFYGNDLTDISGVPDIVRSQGPFPNASTIAGRLFTLPTHDLTTAGRIQSTRRAVLRLIDYRTRCRSS